MLVLRVIFEWIAGYWELVPKRSGRSATEQTNQGDTWKGSCIDDIGTLLKNWIKWEKSEHDVKTSGIATLNSDPLAQTDKQRLWEEENFGKETGGTDNPEVRVRQNIKTKSPGDSVLITRERAEPKLRGNSPGKRAPRTDGRHKHRDRHDAPDKYKSNTPQKPHKYEPWDKHESPSKVDPRYRRKIHYKNHVKQRHRDVNDSSESDSDDDDQLSEYSFSSNTLKLMDKALVRIPYFDPHNKNRDIHTHIATVEAEAMIRGLRKTDEKASLLKRSLHGQSISWVKSLPYEVRNDFKKLSLAVIRKFGEYSTLSEGFNAAKSMTQCADEDPWDYLMRFKRAYYAGDVDQYHEGDKRFKIMFFGSLSPEITEIVGMVLNPETASLDHIVDRAHMAWLYRAKNNDFTAHSERDKATSLSEENKKHVRHLMHAGPQCRKQKAPTDYQHNYIHGWSNNNYTRQWHADRERSQRAETRICDNRHGWKQRAGPYLHPMQRHTAGQNYPHRWRDNNYGRQWHIENGRPRHTKTHNRENHGAYRPRAESRRFPIPRYTRGTHGLAVTKRVTWARDKSLTLVERKMTGKEVSADLKKKSHPLEKIKQAGGYKQNQEGNHDCGKLNASCTRFDVVGNARVAPVVNPPIEQRKLTMKRDLTGNDNQQDREEKHACLVNGNAINCVAKLRESTVKVPEKRVTETKIHDGLGNVWKSSTRKNMESNRGTESDRGTESANLHMAAEKANDPNSRARKLVLCTNPGGVRHGFTPHKPTGKARDKKIYRYEPRNHAHLAKAIPTMDQNDDVMMLHGKVTGYSKIPGHEKNYSVLLTKRGSKVANNLVNIKQRDARRETVYHRARNRYPVFPRN
uniref:Uncharacterized protein LOC116937030 n=1 Tax=Petromyzon marinus TaxID=7757 RepID=A0AAJ7SKF7_PETMA|nr:uncharacterized protein LOC116937030 [Petromyzon marinus]